MTVPNLDAEVVRGRNGYVNAVVDAQKDRQGARKKPNFLLEQIFLPSFS